MQKPLHLLLLFLALSLLLSACAEPLYRRVEQRQSFFEADIAHPGYLKRVAVTPTHDVATQFGRQADARLLQTLEKTLRDDADDLRLEVPGDADFPSFLRGGDPFQTPEGTFQALQTARLQGYRFLIQAAVMQIEPSARRTGIWFFRKERYFMTVAAKLDLYDTFSGAKALSRLVENTVQINPDDYHAYLGGLQAPIPQVDAVVADLAEELGAQAADMLDESAWMTPIVAVDQQVVTLGAGQAAGLRVGDRLAIFEARQIISGYQGQKFTAPGYKLGEVRLTVVDPARAQGELTAPAQIRPGDFAVPTK